MNDIVVDLVVDTMKWLVKTARKNYTCNRPPGAAGALLAPKHGNGGSIFSGVWPAFGSYMPADDLETCKKVGCEIVWETDEPPDNTAEFHGHCVRTVHAEQRVIAVAARNGIATGGSTLFSVLRPCYQCSKLIVVAGIKKIYYAGTAYNEERTRKLLIENDVECLYVDVGLEYGNANI